MKINSFEETIAWQKAKIFSLQSYLVFKDCRDFNFKNQLQRAVVSVMNNIAEGFERRTNKELVNFLYIAKGSCGEVRSMLYLALDLGYVSQDNFNKLRIMSLELSRVIFGFIRSVKDIKI